MVSWGLFARRPKNVSSLLMLFFALSSEPYFAMSCATAAAVSLCAVLETLQSIQKVNYHKLGDMYVTYLTYLSTKFF